MVDIIPNSQVVIGHGAFSIVYKARLKTVSIQSLWSVFKLVFPLTDKTLSVSAYWIRLRVF